jgi:Ca2+-dependent lipid-binding protein
MTTTGKLVVTVIEAQLTRDTEWFAKMDPFCRLKYRDQHFETGVCKKGGKTPKWNENFTFDVKYIGDDLYLEVCDRDMATVDLVASTNIKLAALCMNGITDEWYEVQYKGKVSGKVRLSG